MSNPDNKERINFNNDGGLPDNEENEYISEFESVNEYQPQMFPG